MTQGNRLKWGLPLTVAVILISLYYAMPPFDPDGAGPKEGKIKLGLDLQGGMDLTLRVDTSKLDADAQKDATDRAIEIIRNRIDQFGVSEPVIQKQSWDRITVQLPGVTDRERALALLGKTALLEFKLVAEDQKLLTEALAGKPAEGYRLYKDEDGSNLLVEEKTLLTGKTIKNAIVDMETQFNQPVVSLEFDSEGARLFGDITAANVKRRLAIVLDDKVQSAPVIQEAIPSGRAQISGRFTYEQAMDLAITLRAGALPAPIVIEEERSVGASLGRDSVRQSVQAALVGFVAVVIFMLIYYLLSGFIANLALALNILMTLGALAYFHATLTLPGIAGIVLSIGMAVDTNVLVFERIREERAFGKPVAAALIAGYKKAFTTVLDSHLTTMITAMILYYMGSGPVRGFALTLAIGLIASMFTGIFVTHLLFDLLALKGSLKDLKMLHFFQRTPKFDFLKLRKFCYVLSLVVILIGAFRFLQRGKDMYGVDFTGGTMVELKFTKAPTLEEMRGALDEIGLGSASIQVVSGSTQVIIRAEQGAEKAIQDKLKTALSDNPFELNRLESVGPIVGGELKKKAFWAFLISLVGIWMYVVYRYDFRFAAGAILAIFHDALVALGALALTGRELSITSLAAVLTILGFSINDTIVIFDRIRERRRSGAKETFGEAINTSVNQTMSRTILTTLTVFMVVLALYFKGGDVINDFAFTMLVGLISGTYSTVYIAAPVLIDWPGSKGQKGGR